MDVLLHQIPVFEKIDLFFWFFSAFWTVVSIFAVGFGFGDLKWREFSAKEILYCGISIMFFAVVWGFAKAYPPFKTIDIVFWFVSLFLALGGGLMMYLMCSDDNEESRPFFEIEFWLACFCIIPLGLGFWFLVWLSIKYFWWVWLICATMFLVWLGGNKLEEILERSKQPPSL